MFHGNDDVERGFSINKQCVSYNMQEESLVLEALHRICEEVIQTYEGNGTEFEIRNLELSCRNTSERRKEHIKEKKITSKKI